MWSAPDTGHGKKCLRKSMTRGKTQDDTPTVFKQVKGYDGEDLGFLLALLTEQGKNERRVFLDRRVFLS